MHGTITSELPLSSTQKFKTGGLSGMGITESQNVVKGPMKMAISQRRGINRGVSMGEKDLFEMKKQDFVVGPSRSRRM